MDFHISQFLSPGRKEFVKGTLLLTGAGLFCRVLGFFYRIYMSRTIGAEGLGLYNMIHPLFSIAFAVCAGSIQTALSQYIAASQEKGPAVFKCGLFLSLSLSVIPLLLLWKGKMFLAGNILSEPQAARYLPVLAVSVPFACLHACINGYYYGMNKAHIPSFSQIAEQVIRMGAVWLLVGYLEKNGKSVTVGLAVEGHLIGEMASAAFTFLALFLVPPQRKERQNETLIGETGRQRREQKRVEKENVLGGNAVFANLGPILILALPLMGNRLVLNLLGSAEAILIPSRLIDYGLTNKEALSIYGVLTSMALPFILFPSALTNSMAVLLLPSAAKHRRKKTKAAFLPWSHCLSGTAVTWVSCASVFLPGLAKALARSFSIMSCPALLLWYFAGSVRLCIWQLLWEASKMALEKRVLPSCKICLPWGSVWYLCCLQCRCLVSGDIYGAFWSANCF